MTTTEIKPATPTVSTGEASKVIPDFGTARYSNNMKELYRDAKRLLSLTDKQAEKLARAFGADMGRLAIHTQVKIGEANKDFLSKIKETGSTDKAVRLTHALTLAKLCSVLQGASKYGAEKFGEIRLNESLVEWLNE